MVASPLPHLPRRRSRQAGVSLVEVMVSAALLVMLAGGLTSSVLLSRRMAEVEIYRSSVHTAICGYMEQLKGMTYSELANVQLETQPAPIRKGEWNVPPPIDINHTPLNPKDDIPFRVQPQLINLETDPTAPLTGLSCYEIIINYEYDSRVFGSKRTYSGSLRFVRSAVRSF